MSTLTKTAVCCLIALVTVVIASRSDHASAASGCDLVAATNGSDSAPGTEAAPLKTVKALLDELQSGQTGCVRGGTYIEDKFLLKNPDVTLTSFPGERATLRGHLRFNVTAVGATVEGFNLDGRNPGDPYGPLIYADDVVLRDNDITNEHTAVCVLVDDYSTSPAPKRVVIENNVIHDCGKLPATNLEHGIYVSHADGTVIRNNLIYGNADRGVQLYPDADGSVVTGNVIDGNGEGMIFGGGSSTSSDNNLVAGNVITNSNQRFNIQAHWQGPTGSGNVARDNCVWTGQKGYYSGSPAGSGIQKTMTGAQSAGNVVANPGYADRGAGDYAFSAGSPCAKVLSGSVPTGPSAPSGPSSPGRNGASVCKPGGDTAGRRVLVGGGGRDRLIGGPGRDRLAGKSGADRVVGGEGGPDCLLGGRGPDRIRAVNGRRDIVKCGAGRDRATVERNDRVRGCERVTFRRR
ncbi:MAG TPA: right-handed parallel beta-helix repeat-containing protein [Solirubrobacterales bacterium]|jgi:parallel beta-helix repeat protein|nr:right-handed parallel beta-helix repeat-containing protein [Solirubrobacterales bacterium]